MKQIVLKIPEEKYAFVMELLKSFNYLKIEEEYPIPKVHKDIVLERSAASKKDPSRLLDWDDAKKSLKY
jgi:hypothetical protein